MVEAAKGALSGARKKNSIYYLNGIIAIVLMVAGFIIPPVDPLTQSGMQTVFIFVGVVYAMTTVGVIWPCLLGMVLLGFVGDNTVASVYLNGFGNDTYLFVFFLLIFAAILNSSGLSKTIAYKLVSLKVANGRPWVLSLLIFVAAYLVGMLISCTPGILIPWAIIYTICDISGYTSKDRWPKVMVIGVVLSSCLGNAALPFKPMSLYMMKGLTDATSMTIDYTMFTVFAVTMSLLMVLGYWALCKFAFRVDVKRLSAVKVDFANEVQITAQQKQLCVFLVALFAFLFLPSFLPAGSDMKLFMTRLGSTAVAIGILIVLAFMRKKDGTEYASISEAIKTGVPWQTMIMLAFVMVISSGLTAQGTGVSAALSGLIDPILGSAGGFAFVIALIVLAIIGTQLIGNLVYGLLLMPVLCVYGATTGANLPMLTVALCVVLNVALFLPSASPLAGLLHGNREWVSSTDIYKVTIPTVVVCAAIAIILCGTVGELLF